MRQTCVRHAIRGTAVATGLALGSLAAPAFAAAPSDWEPVTSLSTLEYLLILFGFPLAITAVIFLLTYLPSMIRGGSTEPALVFQEKKEWFGGPRKGLDDSAESDTSDSTGGAGARW